MRSARRHGRRGGVSAVAASAAVAFCCLAAAGAPAGEGASPAPAGASRIGEAESGALGAAALWERFLVHLRSGHLREAYACFSPLSRAAFSFDEFAALYHPVSAVTEAVLSPAEEGQLRVDGDLAEFRFVARAPRAPGDGVDGSAEEGVLVTAVMTREEGAWTLVAARRMEAARTEALLRNLLRALWDAPGVRAARAERRPLAGRELAAAAGDLLDDPAAGFVRTRFDMALTRGPGGMALVAAPREEGYRAFHLDGRDGLRTVRDGTAAAALLGEEVRGVPLEFAGADPGEPPARRTPTARRTPDEGTAAPAPTPRSELDGPADALPPLDGRGDPAAGRGRSAPAGSSPSAGPDRPPPPPPTAAGRSYDEAAAAIASWTEKSPDARTGTTPAPPAPSAGGSSADAETTPETEPLPPFGEIAPEVVP